MKNLSVFLACVIGLWPLGGCKTSSTTARRAAAPQQPSLPPSEIEDPFKGSIVEVEKEVKDFQAEFKALKDALAEYKKTDEYNDPKTEEDKNFKTYIDSTDLLTEEDVATMVSEGKFTQALEKIKTRLDEIVAQADEITTPPGETPTTPTAPTEEGGSSKTSLQHGTGILVTTMAAMGLAVGAGVAGKAYMNGKGLDGKLTQRGKAGVGVGIGIAASAVFPLVVGALIAADDNPNADKVRALQAVTGIGATVAGISAIYVGYNGVAALRSELGTKKLVDALQQPKVYRNLGGSLVLAGIAVGLGIWTSDLGLASRQMTPKQKAAAKIGRAFVAFHALEKKYKR